VCSLDGEHYPIVKGDLERWTLQATTTVILHRFSPSSRLSVSRLSFPLAKMLMEENRNLFARDLLRSNEFCLFISFTGQKIVRERESHRQSWSGRRPSSHLCKVVGWWTLTVCLCMHDSTSAFVHCNGGVGPLWSQLYLLTNKKEEENQTRTLQRHLRTLPTVV